ncbi:ATP-binding cassette transporter [Rasamsonia emersonii CBS 393.64]|uniref:ATP-binding cassette transporter n=1 Tax=Rasamsonia emersonii (strain ATCC 16479 / CBS 393.64 / IMI 116815) TaxID=1408163 RepID=A0A0F4YRY8_RASE3|nr:ATP-binding cassette transporter [Rasamsonia emersonii CBS 393.64]KKA21057.1 ATP-binding cassette transporter [Rasamsonia emersonii CBS 393.64]
MAGLRGGIPAAMGRVASPLQRLPPPLWSPILGMLGSLSGGRELPSRRLCFLSDGRCMLQSIPFWDPCPSLVHTFLLCCIPAMRGCYVRLARNRRTDFDEERALLLSQETCHDDQSGGNINYLTIGHDQSPSGNTETKRRKSGFLESLDTVRYLIPFLWPKGKFHLQLLYIGVGLCLVMDRVLNVLVPLQLGVITDVLSKGDGRPPWKEIMIFIGLRLLDSSGGVSAIRRYMWLPLENYSYQKITTAAFNQIMDLSSDFHDNKRSGSLWQSVGRGSSVRHIMRSVLFQIGPMLADLFLAVSVLYFLFGAYMGLITAAVIIVFLWSSGKILSKQKDKRRQWISDMEQEHNILCESTTNWQTVSYFNRIPYEKSRFSSAVRDHMRSSISFKLWSHLESMVQSTLLVAGLMGACSLAAYQVVQGNKPVGSFVMLLGYWAQLSSPLQFFASGFCDIALDLVNAEDLVALLKRKPAIRDRDGARPLKLNKGEIQFDGVRFSYDGRREVLKGIGFEALTGQTVALVGETGGGKSTILKLLFRFYDPAQGSIKIDGQDIRNVTLESLRANIGVVPQDPALFNDSIMNNIRYAKSSATDEEIYEACKAVTLHEKFLNLPDGYQTLVGERGIKLSGGELQRVAIARAIIKDPKIVLLDEATSSVDSNTESQIQQSLKTLTSGRTTIVIAYVSPKLLS